MEFLSFDRGHKTHDTIIYALFVLFNTKTQQTFSFAFASCGIPVYHTTFSEKKRSKKASEEAPFAHGCFCLFFLSLICHGFHLPGECIRVAQIIRADDFEIIVKLID